MDTGEKRMSQPPKLARSAEEVQHVHDVLAAAFMHALGCGVSIKEPVIADMQTYAGVLCWLLGHPNPEFADRMEILEDVLRRAGVEIIDGQRWPWEQETIQ
jgi:hypothetical protein